MSSERSAAAGSSSSSGGGRTEEDQATLDSNNNASGTNTLSGTLEPLYEQLLNLSFPDSVTAIKHCRELCAQFGFTVKQEASTYRNIYVYCSREGQPDSQRNPKTNPPKRKRPSKRCDCRWRIILHECDGRWEFRKSLNPDAASHNHELLRPEEIDRNWPKVVIDFIQQLAREESTTTSITTANIRSKVQTSFPDLVWNERRFYNRLSEERQKIKHRDTVARARHLTGLWSKVCMATAGNEDLSRHVEAKMKKLLSSTCEMARVDPETLQAPVFQDPPVTVDGTSASSGRGKSTVADDYPASPPQVPKEKGKAVAKKARIPDPPKGFVSVTIPRHSYFVKLHSQRAVNEIQGLNRSASSDTIFSPQHKRSRSALPTATSAAAVAQHAQQQQQQQQQQQHFVQQQHAANPFIYSYSNLGGPVGQYSQDFQHHHQQTFMQPSLFGAQPALHPGLQSDPIVTAAAAGRQHQQQVKSITCDIQPHSDVYPLFSEGASSPSSQPLQANVDKSDLIHQRRMMYIAEQSSQRMQQSSPQTPMHGQYPQ